MRKHITVEIDAEFGSDFQDEVITSAISMTLKEIAQHAIQSHKKNTFHYEIKTGEVKKVRQDE